MAAPGHPSSARQGERIVPRTTVTLHLHGLDLPMELLDLSLGGFAATSPRPFKPTVTHRFTIAVPDHGLSLGIVAKSVYSRAMPAAEEMTFVTGWAFMTGASPADKLAISQLFEAARGTGGGGT
jgi:hypothetical protein